MKNSKPTVIRSVLEEELERNDRMQNRYLQEIEILLKGSIVKRKIGNHLYCYLTYRENQKVIAKYIGKPEEKEIAKIDEEIKKRNHLKEILKTLKQEEKEIKRALR